jgi:hypothetical protein
MANCVTPPVNYTIVRMKQLPDYPIPPRRPLQIDIPHDDLSLIASGCGK